MDESSYLSRRLLIEVYSFYYSRKLFIVNIIIVGIMKYECLEISSDFIKSDESLQYFIKSNKMLIRDFGLAKFN